jgi:hypothetical protein
MIFARKALAPGSGTTSKLWTFICFLKKKARSPLRLDLGAFPCYFK